MFANNIRTTKMKPLLSYQTVIRVMGYTYHFSFQIISYRDTSSSDTKEKSSKTIYAKTGQQSHVVRGGFIEIPKAKVEIYEKRRQFCTKRKNQVFYICS